MGKKAGGDVPAADIHGYITSEKTIHAILVGVQGFDPISRIGAEFVFEWHHYTSYTIIIALGWEASMRNEKLVLISG